METLSETEQQLLDAASEGNLGEVDARLANGADVNARGPSGDTALNEAARNGHLEVVQRLIAAGAELENKGGADLTPLMNAVLGGHVTIAQFLLEGGARVSEDLLSSVQLKLNILEENAEAGMVRPEAAAAWRWILKWLQLAQIKQLKPQTQHASEVDAELLLAAAEGNIEHVTRSIQAGANVNVSDEQDISALRWAARSGHPQVVQALLDAGADVNQQSRLGWTALMQAVIAGGVETVRLLLERGADVQAQTFAEATALDFARDIVPFAPDKQAASAMIRLLEAHGAVASAQRPEED